MPAPTNTKHAAASASAAPTASIVRGHTSDGASELWKRAGEDDPTEIAAPDPARTEAIATVSNRLASPERAKELPTLAGKNSLVLRSLVSCAHIAACYQSGRPR
jgi:hypothetical protein